jgi:hypothetical protein
MHDLAPITDALVLKVGDYPVRAAEKVRGQVKQLEAGITALYEGVREVGMLSARFEKERRELLTILDDLENWLSKAIKSDQLEIKGTDIGAVGTQERLDRIRLIVKNAALDVRSAG